MLVFSESDQLANAMSHLLLLSPSLEREREREGRRVGSSDVPSCCYFALVCEREGATR